jgi:hypothetical protein
VVGSISYKVDWPFSSTKPNPKLPILPSFENVDASPWYNSLEKIALSWNDVIEQRSGKITGDYNAWHVKFEAKIPTKSGVSIDIDGIKELRTVQAGVVPLNARYTWITEIEIDKPQASTFQLHVLRKSLFNRLRILRYKGCQSVKEKSCLVRTTHPEEWQKIFKPFAALLSLTTFIHWDQDGFRVKLFTVAQNAQEIEELLNILEGIAND